MSKSTRKDMAQGYQYHHFCVLIKINVYLYGYTHTNIYGGIFRTRNIFLRKIYVVQTGY